MLAAVPNYDEAKAMSRAQLELFWLGCIYWEPEFCRKQGGLLGLDASMFEHPHWFELGLNLLRHREFQDRDSLPRDLFLQLFHQGLLSRLEGCFDLMSYLPSFYIEYVGEIENRADKRFLPPWR